MDKKTIDFFENIINDPEPALDLTGERQLNKFEAIGKSLSDLYRKLIKKANPSNPDLKKDSNKDITPKEQV